MKNVETNANERGAALVPTLVVVATLVVFSLALITVGMTGARSVNHHRDDYRLASAVESAGILATERLWSGYLQSVWSENGAPGKLTEFQFFLDDFGIQDMSDAVEAGALTLPPEPGAAGAYDMLALADLPGTGGSEFNDVNLDALEVVRVDGDAATKLYVTVSASTKRGEGVVNQVLNRALQQVYTVEPDAFAGFNYGILANNVNCIFCHTNVDSVDRYYNHDPLEYDTFDRVKVGTLESLMLRHNMIDGDTDKINDYDADSYVAGTVYVRGGATDHGGDPIADWSELSFHSYDFDSGGLLQEDDWGMLSPEAFVPATGDPLPKYGNLYLDYPSEYADMPDGKLPKHFPPPFPDTGGVDPDSGLPTDAGANNRFVDDGEFYLAASKAEGAITAGIITQAPHGYVVDDVGTYGQALFVGNKSSLQRSVEGNVVLTGTEANPITIDGTVAIDGDLIINGYVKGSGSILVRGNVYVPTNLQYLDDYVTVEGESEPQRVFGISDGYANELALAAGGNIVIGDYLRSATLQADWTKDAPAQYEIVSGEPTADGTQVGEWSFVLAELSLFNRNEWAKTQPMLPGPGEANLDPSQWTISNLPDAGGTYVPPDPDSGQVYVPRYYNFGPDDVVPIYNRGDLYWDPAKQNWITSEWTEVPLDWMPELLSLADPGDPNDTVLYGAGGDPRAVVSQITSTGSWISDEIYKMGVEFFETQHEQGTPMNIDALLYTNNAIFGLVNRDTPMEGQMIVNGALICSDLGLLVPGKKNKFGSPPENNPNSTYKIGLQLNYDKRLRDQLNVINPNQVKIKRTLWNPTANLL